MGSWCCSIDLVSQQDVGEDRAGPKLEVTGLGQEDSGAEDVTGQQVGRALQASEFPLDAGSQSPSQHGLAHAGNILDQHVTFGQQRHDDLANGLGLSEQGSGEVGFERGDP